VLQNFLLKPGLFFSLAITLSLIFLSGLSEAKNADFSEWIENISESPLPTELRYIDYAPEIEVVGSTVHVMWSTYDNINWTDRFIYYRRSINGGRSWEDKKLLLTGDGYLVSNTANRMSVDGDTVHIFLGHTVGSGGDWSGTLTYIRSRNGGASFEAPRDIISGKHQHINGVYVDSGNGRVTVAYDVSDWTSAVPVEGFASDDNGDTFRRLFSIYPAVDTQGNIWDMRAEGENIYVAFSVARGYAGGGTAFDMYMGVSNDRGRTDFDLKLLSVPSQKKDSNGNGVHHTYSLQDEHYVPKIALDGDNVYVAWSGLDENNVANVFFARSTNNGATFGNTATATRNLLPAGRTVRWGMETIVAKDGYVYLVFLTEGQSNTLVRMRRSTDGGNSFYSIQDLSAPIGISYVTGGWWPVVQTGMTGDDVHVFWTGGGYVHSSDGGANFTNPVMLNKLLGTSKVYRPQIAVGEDGAVHHVADCSLTWYSTGVGGDYDIFYRRYDPFAPEPSANNMALNLRYIRNKGDGSGIEEYGNMQIPASADVNFSNAITLEAWINPTRESNVEGFAVVKKDPFLNSTEGSYALGQWRDGHANARMTTTDAGFHLGGSESLASGAWHHLAMTYDANAGADNFRLYVNGELVGKTTATGNIDTREGLVFVGSTDSYRYANVIIDELRFWNMALSQGEIKARMNITLTGGESGLTAYYNFDETTKDMTGNGNDGVLMYRESFVPGGPTFIPEPPNVKVTMPEIGVSSGKDFGVTINVENDSVIFGVDIAITYDSDLITPKDVKMGESFGNMNVVSDFSVPGKAVLEISGDGISGDGTLVNMTFTSADVANEEAVVEFESVTVIDVNGDQTPATSSEGGKVNILPVPDVKLTIPEIKASPSKDFDVAINLEDESIIFGVKIELDYDSSLMTPKEAKMGGSFGNMDITTDFSVPGKAVIEISGDGVTGSGSLVDMTFTSTDAVNKEAAVEFGNVTVTDVNGEETSATSLQSGKVEIVPIPDVSLTIPEIKTSPGKDFKVPITLEDESIIFGVKIEIDYDSELMTPKEIKLGESFQDKDMEMAVDLSVPGKAVMDITGDGVTGSGPLVDMTFVSDDTVNKEGSVKFGNVTVTDANGEETAATTSESGKVEIVPLPDVKLAIPEIKASPGKDFDVAINLEDESIIFGVKMEIEYDSELMTLKEAELGESFKDKGMALAVDMSVPGKAVLEISGDGVTGSGPLVDMTFASDETANGEAAVDIKSVTVTDANGDESPATSLQSGKVKISAVCVDDSFLSEKDKAGILGKSWTTLPEKSTLLQNFPNPFNPETWIPYQLKEGGEVTLRIFNSQGQLVRKMELGYKPAGSYLSHKIAAYWDGKNSSGQETSSGTYFYNIQAGEFTATKKMVVAR